MRIFRTKINLLIAALFWLIVSLPMALSCSNGEDPETNQKDDAGDNSEDPSDALFDPDHLVEVDIEIAPEDWDLICKEGRGLVDVMTGCESDFEYTWVEATATVDGVTLENIWVRKKGNRGSLSMIRPSLKLDFNRSILEQSAWGVTRMTLNNDKQDSSHTHQCMSYQLFREAGAVAPRCNFARVSVNGNDLGIYSHIEPIKKPFLARYFADNSGNLYEGNGVSDFYGDMPLRLEIKTNEETNDRSDLYHVVEALQVDGVDLYDSLDEVIDMDAFLTFWAMEVIVGHPDSYTGNQNNFYAYHDPTTDKFYFIPWGTDRSFSLDHGFLPSDGIPVSIYAWSWLAYRLYSNLETRAQYHDRLRELLDTVWDEDELLKEVDRIEELTSGDEASLQEQRDFISGRKENILAELVGDGPDWTYPPKAGFPEGVCLPSYEINGRFEAVWGSSDEFRLSTESYFELEPGDVAEELAVLDMHTDEISQPFSSIMTSAGPETGNTPLEIGTSEIFILGRPEQTDSPPIMLVLAFEPTLFGEGELSFQGSDSTAAIVRVSDHHSDLNILGFVGDGKVVFEEVGTNNGDPIKGTFSGVFVPSVFDQFDQLAEL